MEHQAVQWLMVSIGGVGCWDGERRGCRAWTERWAACPWSSVDERLLQQRTRDEPDTCRRMAAHRSVLSDWLVEWRTDGRTDGPTDWQTDWFNTGWHEHTPLAWTFLDWSYAHRNVFNTSDVRSWMDKMEKIYITFFLILFLFCYLARVIHDTCAILFVFDIFLLWVVLVPKNYTLVAAIQEYLSVLCEI